MAATSSLSGALNFVKGAQSTAGSTAAKAGLFANPVGLALAGGQLAFSIANMIQQDKVATQQAYNQSYQNTLNQFKAQQENKQIAAQYSAKLDYTKLQIENNYLAAQDSWVSEQMRLNDIYDVAAYRSQAMQKMLLEAMGTAGAREVYGKSAKRGAMVATLGAYGRSRSQLVDQLMSENEASQMRRKRVEQQYKAQNKLAIAQTAVIPMGVFTPSSSPTNMGGGGFQMASNIFGAGLSAFQTGLSVTPKGMNFLGVPGQANYG